MCGIAGIIDFSGRKPSRLEAEAMALQQRHRGPDGQGIHIQGPVALAHRRLAIIDLATGGQPMSNASGNVWITYNGELYNYIELRDRLIAAGHVFRTPSDTEVIICAWQEWGEKCVEYFRGMFAFAIADYRRQIVFLARDHLGIKPLCYFRSGTRFAFASELQALRTLADCPAEIDLKAIDNYLFLLYVPPPKSIYRDVFKLPPAHRMTLGFDGKTAGPEPYWKLKFLPKSGVSFEEWTERLETVLRDSVRAHLLADVSFGAFLSGGIDSTAVVALMSEQLSAPVKSFAIGFEEAEFNELDYARMAAHRFGTDHHEEIVRAGAVSIMPDLVRHFGEPFGDSSAIPTYFVSRLARRHVTMVLSGDGGDEAFYGYGRYFQWHDWVNPGLRNRTGWKRYVRPALQVLLPNRFPTRRPIDAHEWLPWVAAMDREIRRGIWRPEFLHLVDEPIGEIEDILRDARDVPPEQIGQYIDTRSYLPNDILTKVDISSMMNSLESRTPLTDVRVSEFAATMPWQMNLRRNSHGDWTGKHVLKNIVRKYFGEDFIERKKTGFGVPLNHWFAKGGALRQELDDRFCSGHARINQYFRPDVVQKLVERHEVGTNDNSQMLWQLLFLENWLEQVYASEPAMALQF
jgi:asparagine synthase (glutamine-hydrolysing)